MNSSTADRMPVYEILITMQSHRHYMKTTHFFTAEGNTSPTELCIFLSKILTTTQQCIHSMNFSFPKNSCNRSKLFQKTKSSHNSWKIVTASARSQLRTVHGGQAAVLRVTLGLHRTWWPFLNFTSSKIRTPLSSSVLVLLEKNFFFQL